jgi:hypothetical protein
MRLRGKGTVLPFEEPDTYREGGGGNTKNSQDGRRPRQSQEKGTELDLYAVNECLGTALIIE